MTQGPRRWREQRWLVDGAIRTEGVEWDQPRLGFTMRPIGIDATCDFATVRARVRKFSDIMPVFCELAERRERLARTARDAGHEITARDHYFIAALLYVSAGWPIFAHTAQLRELEERKNACYTAWAERAPHRVERVEIPFGDASLPAWFHLPRGHQGGSVPLVLACGGMDAFKEINVAMYGDKLLERGFAVLAFDGPGQGEAIVRGIHTTTTNWVDAGHAVVAWACSRPEVDPARMVGFGISFGSYWMTQIAATQPRLRGAVVSMVCHQPGHAALLDLSSPTFKARFMWMVGIDDEDEFDRYAAGFDLRELVAGMRVPWLAIGGEDDELSPIAHTYDLAARAAAPAPLLIYQGERHSLQALDTGYGGSAATLGPNWYTTAADWLFDRVHGRPVAEEFRYVRSDGTVEVRPHPKIEAQ